MIIIKKKESWLEKLNKYSNLVVGIATLLLVIVTSVYIGLSWKIASQTKRLADISVEQFKIKAYPVFLLESLPITYDNGKFEEGFKFINMGQLAAHETKPLTLNIFKTKEGFLFLRDKTPIYKDLEKNDRITIFNYSKKVPPGSSFTYKSSRRYKEKKLHSLTYKLIYLRFKVPYDNKYKYETFAYILENAKSEDDKSRIIYNWEALTDDEKKNLIKEHFKHIPNEKDVTIKKEIRDFLEDFIVKG